MTTDTPPSESPPSEALKQRIVEVLQTVYDPEIPVNIYEIGLIYEIDIDPSNAVKIQMTLTRRPVRLPGHFRARSNRELPERKGCPLHKSIGLDPPWSPAKMSEAAKLQLGML